MAAKLKMNMPSIRSLQIFPCTLVELPQDRLGPLRLCSSSFTLGGCARSSPQPVTVTFLDVEWDTSTLNPSLVHDLQDFTKQTGIEVKRLPRPDGSLNQLALWRALLKKGGPTPDVLSIDVIWSGILNQYLMDLKPYFANELSAQDPSSACELYSRWQARCYAASCLY